MPSMFLFFGFFVLLEAFSLRLLIYIFEKFQLLFLQVFLSSIYFSIWDFYCMYLTLLFSFSLKFQLTHFFQPLKFPWCPLREFSISLLLNSLLALNLLRVFTILFISNFIFFICSVSTWLFIAPTRFPFHVTKIFLNISWRYLQCCILNSWSPHSIYFVLLHRLFSLLSSSLVIGFFRYLLNFVLWVTPVKVLEILVSNMQRT